METGSATAPSLLVGVVEDEFAAELVFLVGHLSADKGDEGLAIDDHLHPFLLHHFIEFFDLVVADVIHIVAEA